VDGDPLLQGGQNVHSQFPRRVPDQEVGKLVRVGRLTGHDRVDRQHGNATRGRAGDGLDHVLGAQQIVDLGVGQIGHVFRGQPQLVAALLDEPVEMGGGRPVELPARLDEEPEIVGLDDPPVAAQR